jgi:hypothetical protein
MSKFHKITHMLSTPPANLSVIENNIISNRSSGIDFIKFCDTQKCDNPIALIGGGPSLNDNIAELKKISHTMACGSAHDHAVKMGINLKWTVLYDPNRIMADYVSSAVDSCTYLISSACDEEVLKKLSGKRNLLWNCHYAGIESDFWGEERKSVFYGGSNVGVMAFLLAFRLGYRNFHMFGFDGHIPKNKSHAYELTDGDSTHFGDVLEIRIGSPNGKSFFMYPYLLTQLIEMSNVFLKLKDHIKVKIYGDSPLSEAWNYAKTLNDEVSLFKRHD